MIVNIYIKGQIGNTLDDNGEIITRGVTLLDVVEQVYAHPQESIKRFVIDSPGGYVTIGNDIANFIAELPNAQTHGVNQVASIATRIFLAVPKENRTIESGTEFMIHNPWVSGAIGDAEELSKIVESLEKDEADLESFYSKATGLDKTTLSTLMRAETTLTPEQCVKFGFAQSITQKELSPILALNYNQKQEMKKEEKNLLQKLIAKISGEPEVKQNEDGRNIVAISVPTDNGTIENDLEDIQVNDIVTVDGQENASGTYTTEEGVIYEIVDGAVITITEPNGEEDEMAALRAENEKLKAENESLVEAHKVELEERDKNTAEITAKVEALALLKSEGEVVAHKQTFPKKKELEGEPKRKTIADAKKAMGKN